MRDRYQKGRGHETCTRLCEDPIWDQEGTL